MKDMKSTRVISYKSRFGSSKTEGATLEFQNASSRQYKTTDDTTETAFSKIYSVTMMQGLFCQVMLISLTNVMQ